MNIQAIDTRHGTANQHSFQMGIVYPILACHLG